MVFTILSSEVIGRAIASKRIHVSRGIKFVLEYFVFRCQVPIVSGNPFIGERARLAWVIARFRVERFQVLSAEPQFALKKCGSVVYVVAGYCSLPGGRVKQIEIAFGVSAGFGITGIEFIVYYHERIELSQRIAVGKPTFSVQGGTNNPSARRNTEC